MITFPINDLHKFWNRHLWSLMMPSLLSRILWQSKILDVVAKRKTARNWVGLDLDLMLCIILQIFHLS